MNIQEGDLMNIGPEYPSYEVPVENLRFDELPPEIADAMEHAGEEDPVDRLTAVLMDQMLGDVEDLTVQLAGAHALLKQFHLVMRTFPKAKYPAIQMTDFLLKTETLLERISITYVPAVDSEPEKG